MLSSTKDRREVSTVVEATTDRRVVVGVDCPDTDCFLLALDGRVRHVGRKCIQSLFFIDRLNDAMTYWTRTKNVSGSVPFQVHFHLYSLSIMSNTYEKVRPLRQNRLNECAVIEGYPGSSEGASGNAIACW